MKLTGRFTTFQALKELKQTMQVRQRGKDVDVIHGAGREDSREPRTDEEVFFEAMAEVREIREFREIPFRKATEKPLRHQRRDDGLAVLTEIVNGKRRIRLSDTGEYIEWTRPGLRKDIAKRLHQGDFAVQDFIDLHGMTAEEAEHALRLFFRDAVRRRLFCVKVVHGRGLGSPRGPVIKEALKHLLHGSFRKWISAYATAKDCDGGLGATYIILKSG